MSTLIHAEGWPGLCVEPPFRVAHALFLYCRLCGKPGEFSLGWLSESSPRHLTIILNPASFSRCVSFLWISSLVSSFGRPVSGSISRGLSRTLGASGSISCHCRLVTRNRIASSLYMYSRWAGKGAGGFNNSVAVEGNRAHTGFIRIEWILLCLIWFTDVYLFHIGNHEKRIIFMIAGSQNGHEIREARRSDTGR